MQTTRKRKKRYRIRKGRLAFVLFIAFVIGYMAWQCTRAPKGFWDGTYRPPIDVNQGQLSSDYQRDILNSNPVLPSGHLGDLYSREYEFMMASGRDYGSAELPKVEVRDGENQEISLGTFYLTAYCPCIKCCEIWSAEHSSRIGTDYIQKTASGTVPEAGRTVAADWDVLSPGTEISINGHHYIVEDRGGGVKGNHIDIYFDTHEEAIASGYGGDTTVEVFKIQEPD